MWTVAGHGPPSVNAPPLCELLAEGWLGAGEESYDGRGVVGADELGVELETGIELELAAALTGVLGLASVGVTVEPGRRGVVCPAGRLGDRRIVE